MRSIDFKPVPMVLPSAAQLAGNEVQAQNLGRSLRYGPFSMFTGERIGRTGFHYALDANVTGMPRSVPTLPAKAMPWLPARIRNAIIKKG